MADLMFTYLRIGLMGSVMILVVLLARPLLRKAPRNIACLLWLLVALRLLIPFQLESPLSLQPWSIAEPIGITQMTQELPQEPVIDAPQASLIQEPEVNSQAQPPIIESRPTIDPQPITKTLPVHSFSLENLCVFLWIAGCSSILLYAVISLVILQYRLQDAVRCEEGVWESDRIVDAFLLGYWKPRIYLPADLPHQDRELILCHERAHKSRADQWWKLLGLVCLSVHWFNPLVWLGYWLMCRDIEDACDEKVISNLDLPQRKNYSLALLNSGKRTTMLLSCPVAFGEVNLKHRIKSVLSYRKPGLWVTLGAITITAVIAVCFMTTPASAKECVHEFDSQITAEATCLEAGSKTNTCKLCGYTQTEPVTALGHHYDNSVVTLEPSCSTPGIRTYACTLCNKTQTETIPTIAHSFGAIEETQALTKEATCLEEGQITVSCIICGAQELVGTTPKSDVHTYEDHVLRSSTCIDPGEGQQVCILCGHSVSHGYELTEHTYSNAVVTKEATCTAKGEQTYTCTLCGDVKTENLPKTDHTWNEAKCNTATKCTVCGKKGTVQGHNYVTKSMFPAYPTSLGTKKEKCTRCGVTKTTYFGNGGTYNMDALQSTGVAYTKKLGFITDPCPGHGSYSKITREPYYSVVSLNGGMDRLEDMLIAMIDELDRRCEDNSQYYAEVRVDYVESHTTREGSYFRLEVYYHLCTQ